MELEPLILFEIIVVIFSFSLFIINLDFIVPAVQ